MAIKKEDYGQERQVIENGKVVTYGIPHGRTAEEIISATPLSEEPVFQEKVAEQKEASEAAMKEQAEKKEALKKGEEENLIKQNEDTAKRMQADGKKSAKKNKAASE